jgi:Flp pilus assembly pilin Flp
VNTIQQQASYTVPNITKITTYWNYITQPSPSPTPNPIPPPNNTSPQPPVLPESWITFQKAGPGGVGGNYIVKYGPGGLAPVLVTYNSTVAQQWGSAFQSLGNAISNTLDAIGSALTNVVTAPISILTGFANAIDNAISNGLRAVNLP